MTTSRRTVTRPAASRSSSSRPAEQPAATGVLARMNRVRHANGWIYGTMLFSSCLSLIASFVLSKEAIDLAANPAALRNRIYETLGVIRVACTPPAARRLSVGGWYF